MDEIAVAEMEEDCVCWPSCLDEVSLIDVRVKGKCWEFAISRYI